MRRPYDGRSVASPGRRGALDQAPGPQDLGDAPGLGDAAARGMGRLGLEDLAHRAEGLDGKLVGERAQGGCGAAGVADMRPGAPR